MVGQDTEKEYDFTPPRYDDEFFDALDKLNSYEYWRDH